MVSGCAVAMCRLYAYGHSGEGGMRGSPDTWGRRIASSSTKHHDQSSPGWIERMIGWPLCGGVLARVPVRRGVAAAHLAARQADPEVAPRVAGRKALGAAVHLLRKLGDLNAVEMCARSHMTDETSCAKPYG